MVPLISAPAAISRVSSPLVQLVQTYFRPASVDAGWTHCGTIDHDKTRYFKSVRRKVAGFEDGRCILQDMDNSIEDFNTECIPSVIEEQGTAIDAQGTKATTRTWDGVMPME